MQHRTIRILFVALGLTLGACGSGAAGTTTHAGARSSTTTSGGTPFAHYDRGYHDGYRDALLAASLGNAIAPNGAQTLGEAIRGAHPVDASTCAPGEPTNAAASAPMPADTDDAMVPEAHPHTQSARRAPTP